MNDSRHYIPLLLVLHFLICLSQNLSVLCIIKVHMATTLLLEGRDFSNQSYILHLLSGILLYRKKILHTLQLLFPPVSLWIHRLMFLLCTVISFLIFFIYLNLVIGCPFKLCPELFEHAYLHWSLSI